MGLFFTILYIVTAYLGPDTIFGMDLAQLHIEIAIVVIALMLSLFSASGSGLLTMVQTWAIVGLCLAVACSMVFNGWIGGGPKMLMEFVPGVTSFFLVVMNCRKKWHLQALALGVFCAAAFNVCMASYALLIEDTASKYILMQVTSEGSQTYIARIRGTSFLSDPNDLAQLMVSLIPCMFLFWKKGSAAQNLMLVYLPGAFLIGGMFLTHSRGGMVALMAVAIMAGRRKIGVLPAVMIGMALFAGLTLLGFSGGRDVSAGEDRVAAWSVGLTLVRQHPLFGVGYQRFGDFNEVTAHNTFVVCAAELGLLGVFSWILLMFATIRNSFAASLDPNAPVKQKKNEPGVPRGFPEPAGAGAAGVPVRSSASLAAAPLVAANRLAFAGGSPQLSSQSGLQYPADIRFGDSDAPEVSDHELRRMNGLMVLMFTGFLTAGWFLSRAYTMCLYVNAGMATAIYMMARERGIAPEPLPVTRALRITAGLVVGLLIVVYLIVRVDHFMPK